MDKPQPDTGVAQAGDTPVFAVSVEAEIDIDSLWQIDVRIKAEDACGLSWMKQEIKRGLCQMFLEMGIHYDNIRFGVRNDFGHERNRT